MNLASANHVKQSRDSDAFLTSKNISTTRDTYTPQQTLEQQSARIKIYESLPLYATRASHHLRSLRIKTPNNAMHYARIRHSDTICKTFWNNSKCLIHPAATLAEVSNTLVAAQEQEGQYCFPILRNSWLAHICYDRNSTRYLLLLAKKLVYLMAIFQTNSSRISTAKAKYVSATTATQELLFLKTFLTEIRYPINKTTTLYSDSQSAISNTKNIQLRHASNTYGY
ncbi:hypothetical protein BASA83_007747 [Batrachochytrium salamandrivorans]|nr:hypothetical protein BASA83_007747 [Batrachochytrium salamandrivorans]